MPRGGANRRAPIALLVSIALGCGALCGCYVARVRGGGPGDDAGDPALDTGAPDDAAPIDDAAVLVDAHIPPFDGGVPFDAGTGLDGGIRFDAGLPDGGSRPDAGIDAMIDGGAPRSIALRFAPDRYVHVPHRPPLDIAASSTYELWIRARGPGIVSRKGQDVGQQHFLIAIEGRGDATELVAGWTTVDLVRHHLRVPFAAHLGRWTHVAYVLEPRGVGRLGATLYVDLAPVATADVPDDTGAAFNTEGLRLGRFDGDLDEIRIWNVVRSEVSLRANALTRIRGTAGLAAYWAVEEGSGQILLDRSLRGNDGILGARTTVDDRDPSWIFDGAIP